MKSVRLRWLTAITLAVAMLIATPPEAIAQTDAAGATCWVKNVRTMEVGTDLWAAVADARAGDTLKIRGICYGGGLTIDKNLTLVGPATISYPVCDGDCGYGSIIMWVDDGRVTLRNITVTGGKSTWEGGGVHNYATLILRGATSITGNWAEDGGGGVLNYGTLVMGGRSSVSGNSLLWGYGGGIFNYGTLVMRGESSVVGNEGTYGGGIANHGTVIMKHRSFVAGNSAYDEGGGFYNYSDGTLVMTGGSSITANTADIGGGILNEGTVRFARRWYGTVCGNDPDDWPSCLP